MRRCPSRIPESISKILISSIHGITGEPCGSEGLTQQASRVWLEDCSLATQPNSKKTLMPQEVSVSYQAVKSKVYRLVDALVVGEKSEAEVQESIRRWWELIHPADRPIAQKYLAMVLERSSMALDAVEGGLIEARQPELHAPEATKALKLINRFSKHASFSSAV